MVFKTLLQLLAQGVAEYVPTGTNVPLYGTVYTQQSLVQALNDELALFAAVDRSKKQYVVALQALKASQPEARQLVTGLGMWLRASLGLGNPLLAKLGIKPGGRKAPTALSKAKSVAQGHATRKARHTMGKKQRLSIVAPSPTVQILGSDGVPVQSLGPVTPAGSSGGGSNPNGK